MSLQRRIAAAAAFGVAAVCLILVPVGYLSTRAKMHQEIRQELVRITAQYLQPAHPPHSGAGNGSPNGISVPGRHNAPPGSPSADGDTDNSAPTCTFRRQREGGGGEIGAPTGYIQVVC